MIDIMSILFPFYPLFIFITSIFVAFFTMPFVLKIAINKQMVVEPNSRTSHEGLIPNIGGVNVFMSVMFTILIYYFWREHSINYVLFGSVLIFITGLVDDIISISPIKKLLGQITGIAILLFLGQAHITSFYGLFGVYELSPLISYLFTFFVAIVIINAINLIDGIDGLASGLGVIITLFLGIYFYVIKAIEPSFIAFAMSGSLIVFFIYNVFGDKGKIFLGDSGSLVIGYFISYLVIRFMELNIDSSTTGDYFINAVPGVAISLLGIPLFDTMRVFIFRISKGTSPFMPDKNHIHHHLLNLGLSHLSVSLIMIFINMLFLIVALLLRNTPILFLIFINILIGTLLMGILLYFEKRKLKNKL